MVLMSGIMKWSQNMAAYHKHGQGWCYATESVMTLVGPLVDKSREVLGHRNALGMKGIGFAIHNITFFFFFQYYKPDLGGLF